MSAPFTGQKVSLGNQEPPKIEPKYEINAGPRVDRAAYLQNYTGTARFERELYIGLHSTICRNEYLTAALEEAKNGQNPHHYILAREACIHFGLLKGPGGDDKWLNDCEERNNVQKSKLDANLREHKRSGVKADQRAGYRDLANFYRSTGDYSKAIDQYKKLRIVSESEADILEINIGATTTQMAHKSWNEVYQAAQRVYGISTSSAIDPEEANNGMKLYGISVGLSHLMVAHHSQTPENKYKQAAACFLVVPAGLDRAYNEFVSSNDVAVYGAVCALATMTREQLQKDCLESSRFRTYLELEPQIRKAISHFINGKYAACLSIIEGHRNDFLLDVYLGEHTEKLLQMIRDRCIVNYCYPFSIVKLDTLNQQFAKEGADIITQLAELIQRGLMNARIDVMAGTLNAILTPPRIEIQRQTLKTVQDYERELKRRILHMSIVNAGLEVKPKKGALGNNDDVMITDTRDFHRAQNFSGYSGGGNLGHMMETGDYGSSDEAFQDDEDMGM